MSFEEQRLIPHLTVDDAIAAIDFYKQGLGATENLRMPAEDGNRLIHAELLINGSKVFVMDDFPEYYQGRDKGKSMTPKSLGGTSVALHLEVKNCDEAFKRAIAAGAKTIMEPMDAFWGARYGQVVDPFGHRWSFAHPLPGK